MDSDGMDHTQDALLYYMGATLKVSEFSFSMDPTIVFGSDPIGPFVAGVACVSAPMSVHFTDKITLGLFTGAWARATGADGSCLN